MIRTRRDTVKFFILISPWIIGFIVFTLAPMLMSLYYSFTDWDVLSKANWVGLENYTGLFKDELFYQSLKVTLVYTAFTVPLDVFVGLLLAMLLNIRWKYVGAFRVIYYLPSVISGVVLAVLYGWIFSTRFGLINMALDLLGIEGPRWLSDPDWTMTTFIIMSIWGVGGGLLTYLSSLQAVPDSLYKLAKIDGAGFWARLRYITIPAMSPMILYIFLTSIIDSLQTFSAAYVMTDGGPDNASLFYALYLYNNGFEYRKMGKACAMGWILFIVIMAISLLVMHYSRKTTYYESEEGGPII